MVLVNERPPTWLIVAIAVQGLQAVFPLVALVILVLDSEIPVDLGEAATMVTPIAVVAMTAVASFWLWKRGSYLPSKLVAFLPAFLALAAYAAMEIR